MNHPTNREKYECMLEAMRFRSSSPDPSYKVGAYAVIADTFGTGDLFDDVSGGFNAPPKGWGGDFPWDVREPFEESKYAFVIHAEMNALSESTWDGSSFDAIFITGYPCIECAKLIVARGVKQVYYLEDAVGPTAHLASPVPQLFAKTGVYIEKLHWEALGFLVEEEKAAIKARIDEEIAKRNAVIDDAYKRVLDAIPE